MGSYKKDGTFNPTGKIIFKTYKTRAEIYLHDLWDVGVNPYFANLAKVTSTGFCTARMRHREESKAAKGNQKWLGKKHTEDVRGQNWHTSYRRNKAEDV